MTLCVLSGRDLGHVHHACNADFLGGLGEDGSSLNDPGTDGVAKVSPCDALKRRSDVIQVEKITEHDFGTQPLEPFRPVVLSMGQGSDMVPAGQYLLNGCPPSVPGRSGDQKCSPTHAWLPPEYDKCRSSAKCCNEAQAPTAEMAVTPPSIRKSAPTTYAESSDAR